MGGGKSYSQKKSVMENLSLASVGLRFNPRIYPVRSYSVLKYWNRKLILRKARIKELTENNIPRILLSSTLAPEALNKRQKKTAYYREEFSVTTQWWFFFKNLINILSIGKRGRIQLHCAVIGWINQTQNAVLKSRFFLCMCLTLTYQ